MFLVAMDSQSKLLEVLPVANATSCVTIFATHGLRELLVADSGTAFTSKGFNGTRYTDQDFENY